ncbi:MAG: glycosyltransferase family protein [Leucobacter sp.]
MTGVFISWTKQNGRTADLAPALGLEPRYVYLPSRLGLPGRYLRQVRATRRILREERPPSAALMLPPAPALLALVGGKRRPERLVFDLHTGFFLDPKWAWALRPSLWFMRRIGGTAIVTGSHLRQVCERAGVPAIVLHDVVEGPAVAAAAGAAAAAASPVARPGAYVLCPLSYANDEPVAAILAAAALTPETEWKLTGKAPAPVVSAAPPNVRFTGFVSEAEYAALVRGALGVVALTTRAHTMQRAGYEAFGAGVPQLTSDFPELRGFYGDSALYTAPEAEQIADGVRELAAQREDLVAAMGAVWPDRAREQRAGLQAVREALGAGGAGVSGAAAEVAAPGAAALPDGGAS